MSKILSFQHVINIKIIEIFYITFWDTNPVLYFTFMSLLNLDSIAQSVTYDS